MVAESHSSVAEHNWTRLFARKRLPEKGECVRHIIEKTVTVSDEENIQEHHSRYFSIHSITEFAVIFHRSPRIDRTSAL